MLTMKLNIKVDYIGCDCEKACWSISFVDSIYICLKCCYSYILLRFSQVGEMYANTNNNNEKNITGQAVHVHFTYINEMYIFLKELLCSYYIFPFVL